jgi:hypothetical protein
MQEQFAGYTYDGRHYVADATIGLPRPPECGRLIVGPTGFVLLSPLPDQRMLIFVNRDHAGMRREPPREPNLVHELNCRTGIDEGVVISAGFLLSQCTGARSPI